MYLKIFAITFALAGVSACNVITNDLLGSNNDAKSDAAADTPPPPAGGLLVHYAFEDSSGTVVTDSSERGLDGVLSDPAAWTADGRANRGLSMSGTTPATQFVSLPGNVLTGANDFTIAVWVKLDTTVPWARIYDIGNGLPDPQNRFMYLTPNGFTGPVNDGIHASSYGGSVSNESVLATSTQLPTGVWKHLALTGSGGQRQLFIDGFPAATVASGPSVPPREMEPIAPNSWLGRSRFPVDPGFDGVMDEFIIYNRVLSPTEIADLGWPRRDYSHWRFDEGSGTQTTDSSDNAIATTLTSGVDWTTGRLGGAIDLPGGAAGPIGPHVVLAGNPLASCSSQFTIAAWIKVRQLQPGARVFDFGTPTNSHVVYLAPSDGTGTHFGMVSPAGTFDMVTTTPSIGADNAFHHVAVTVDSAGVAVLYVDGATVKSQASPAVRPADFANLTQATLGKSRSDDPYFNGVIDELRIACRALTPDEIKNLSRP